MLTGFFWLTVKHFLNTRNQTRDVGLTLENNDFGAPGRSGIFGTMVGSHTLMHDIGGEDDTNANTTRRVLLLLESFPIGDRSAFRRVRQQILSRYVHDDRGLLYSSGTVRVPRFLLNDSKRLAAFGESGSPRRLYRLRNANIALRLIPGP